MSDILFDEKDLEQIKLQNTSPEKVLSQLESFKKGFPFTKLVRPCTLGDGIYKIAEEEFSELLEIFSNASQSSRITKFVPASGAASRMFKLLQTFNELESVKESDIKEKAEQGNKDCKELDKFITNLKSFAFYNDLKIILAKNNIDIEQQVELGEYKNIIDYLLTDKGLNYANQPKGLLKFHKYSEPNLRTSFEEHLVEGVNYTKDKENKVKLHFTVSPEHQENVISHFNQVVPDYEKDLGANFDISYSVQKSSTDTIAVDMENKPFKDKKGNLVFRPGGHGALIENLDDLQGDIIFIKNIDNVVPDRLKETTYKYKKALAGYLIKLQNQIFSYLKILESGDINAQLLDEVFGFMHTKLFITIPEKINNESIDNKINFAFKMLNRPTRVCGMVKNEGEPGGGPFWVLDENGSVSLQIVETSQINTDDKSQKEILANSTHFNPVDLICGVKDYKGNNFDLKDFIDHNTGFISAKSKDGRDLKALELPGLWNGAMAKWNTVFIEVPAITFNPVKTVNDLLRDEHQ